MLITFFNSHAITNRILIIVLEGTLDTNTQKQLKTLFLGFSKHFFQIFMWFSEL
jgi:anti-anti-sigma regulatory factor